MPSILKQPEKQHKCRVLVGKVSPEHSLNRNSNLVQSMFRVRSEYVLCHTSFMLCSDFQEKFGFSSNCCHTLFIFSWKIRVLFKLLSHFVPPAKKQERPGTSASNFVQVLFRLEEVWELQRLPIHISFSLRSHSNLIHSLFKFRLGYSRLGLVSLG